MAPRPCRRAEGFRGPQEGAQGAGAWSRDRLGPTPPPHLSPRFLLGLGRRLAGLWGQNVPCEFYYVHHVGLSPPLAGGSLTCFPQRAGAPTCGPSQEKGWPQVACLFVGSWAAVVGVRTPQVHRYPGRCLGAWSERGTGESP